MTLLRSWPLKVRSLFRDFPRADCEACVSLNELAGGAMVSHAPVRCEAHKGDIDADPTGATRREETP